MAGWTKEMNKDYHFIAIQATTTKNYGFQFAVSISGSLEIYMLMKSISQKKGSYLVTDSLNLAFNYWVKASASMEMTTLKVGISTYSKGNVKAVTEATAAEFPITILGDTAKISHIFTEVLHERTGVARINLSAVQATV